MRFLGSSLVVTMRLLLSSSCAVAILGSASASGLGGLRGLERSAPATPHTSTLGGLTGGTTRGAGLGSPEAGGLVMSGGPQGNAQINNQGNISSSGGVVMDPENATTLVIQNISSLKLNELIIEFYREIYGPEGATKAKAFLEGPQFRQFVSTAIAEIINMLTQQSDAKMFFAQNQESIRQAVMKGVRELIPAIARAVRGSGNPGAAAAATAPAALPSEPVSAVTEAPPPRPREGRIAYQDWRYDDYSDDPYDYQPVRDYYDGPLEKFDGSWRPPARQSLWRNDAPPPPPRPAAQGGASKEGSAFLTANSPAIQANHPTAGQ